MNPLSRTDDALGDPQKTEDCGDPAITRTARVTTYKPGETISVEWKETIDHPGWLRISFQPNGEAFRAPPASNGANSAGAASNFPTEDLTGMMDPDGSGSMILMDRVSDGALNVMRQMNVTMPNMECNNCTLHFIQVMIDKPPYTVDVNSDDIYLNCADITLAANAPDAGVQPTADAGMDPGGGGSNNPGGGEVSGGCSTGSGSGGAARRYSGEAY